MDRYELDDLRVAARGALARVWPGATCAGSDAADAAVTGAWDVAVELGWSCLGGTLDALVVVMEELGRAACPVPVADAAAAALVFAEQPETLAAIEDGRIRPTLATARGDRLCFVEAATAATHALVLPDGGDSRVRLYPITSVTPTPGLAAPPWSDVAAGNGPEADIGPATLERARSMMRLALAARAMGGASRAHELALDHARDRHQFGRAIGSFQAVAHRAVDAHVECTAWASLRDAASSGDPVDIEIAVDHALSAAPWVQHAAQHTLAAIGYFEEHEAVWLFRRVHADVVRARAISSTASAADRLLDGAAALPELDFGPEAATARAELERMLDELGAPESTAIADDPRAVTALGAAGWIAPGIDPEHGGRGASVAVQMAVDELIQRRRVPVRVARGMASTLSGAIAEFGSPEQRAYFLPSLARGETRCHLGYSEPDVGSDLASLSTRARRDGDDWIVDGTKMWGTGANVADYVWLATRTDPDVPKHRGITMFLAPTRLPGWSLVEHRALSGEIACTTVFDGVRIPDSCRVGEVDGGWSVITSALVAERVVMAGLVGEMTRQVTDLLSALRAAPSLAPAGSAARVTVNDLVVRLQAARSLLGASARAAADGTGGWLEAPMAKVVTGDLGERLAAAALEILGPDAAFGDTDHALRLAPMYVIGGGTADIQRNLIARAIGLPRS